MMAAPRPVSKSDSTQVLIVGAGPAGLMLASELQRFGVEHRIVDRLEAPTGQSRATDLQPRSLEILARCGALARVEERGSPVHAINIYSGPQRICRMTFAARVRAPIEARVVVPGDAEEGEVADVGGALHRRYGASRGGLFLVRPDGYVAFRGPSLDARPLLAHLRERAALGVA